MDAIISKLKTSKALSEQPGISEASASDHPILSPASPSREVKKAQVHFSHASPTIIPIRADTMDDEDGDEGEEEEERGHYSGPTAINGTTASHDHTEESGSGIALYDFVADGNDELSISEGEHLIILERDGDEWWKCRNQHGVEGVVPASYIEVFNYVSFYPYGMSIHWTSIGSNISCHVFARERNSNERGRITGRSRAR